MKRAQKTATTAITSVRVQPTSWTYELKVFINPLYMMIDPQHLISSCSSIILHRSFPHNPNNIPCLGPRRHCRTPRHIIKPCNEGRPVSIKHPPGLLGKFISLVFGKKGYQEAFPFSSRTRSGSFKNIKITESIAYTLYIPVYSTVQPRILWHDVKSEVYQHLTF